MPEGDTLRGFARSIDAALAGQTLVRAYCTRLGLARFEGRSVSGARAQYHCPVCQPLPRPSPRCA